MGRGYAAAKARRQAAGATAAGQGAVAEPVVTAQPAPAGQTPEQAALVAERAMEVNANSTKADMIEYEKHRRAASSNEKAYDRKEESIFRIQYGAPARDYREVADATILGRDAAQTLANAIRSSNGGLPNVASSAAKLKDGMRLLRIASNRLKNTPVRRYGILELDIRDAGIETRQAVNLLRQAATDMNINLRLPNLPR